MVVKEDKVSFEDALTMTGFGKFNFLAFLLCSSIIVGMSCEIFSVSYLVPASGCELGTTSAQQGYIAAVPLIGIIMTSHVWGYLADTRGRRKILVLSMTLAFISGSLAAFSPNWIVLAILKFFSSAAVSGALALGLTLLSEYTPLRRRSTVILLTTSIFLVSSGLMAVIAIPVLPLKFSYYVPYLDIHFNSWRLLDLIFAMPTAIAAIGVACSFESPKYLLSVGQNDEALKVLKAIFTINSGKDGELYKVNSLVLDEEGASTNVGFWASIKAQTLPMIKPPLLKNALLLSVLSFIVYFCINPFMVWLPFIMSAIMDSVERGSTGATLCEMIRTSRNSTMIVEETDACSMNQTALLMVFGISMLIGVFNLLTSSIVNCVGRKPLFIGLQVIGGVAALCINASTIWVLSSIFFVIFITGIINFGSLTSFLVDTFPTYVKAMAICLTLMVGRASAVISINLLKNLLDNDCEAAFYSFGGIAIAGGVIGLLLPSETKLMENKELLKQRFASKT